MALFRPSNDIKYVITQNKIEDGSSLKTINDLDL